MPIKIGSAPAAWGVNFPSDPHQTPWSRYLDEVAEAGYEWTELGPYGYLPTDRVTLERELGQRGLKLAGGFLMPVLEDPEAWPDIEKTLLSLGELLAGLDAKFLVLIDDEYTDQHTGEPVAAVTLDQDAWKILIDTTHAAAQIASQEFGLRLVYHPHADTHVEYEAQIEKFLDDTDPSLVGLALDTGHHAYRGGDPVAFIRKHHQRLEYLHFKSVDQEMRQAVQRDRTPIAIATAQGLFCEPWRGVVDFVDLRNLLAELSYDSFAIVEQDMYPTEFDKPLPIARQTRAYFKAIDMG
tara:strand:- start:470 stop:1357 length:888 start_codon:yes stop_codon:yes gene_type:complete